MDNFSEWKKNQKKLKPYLNYSQIINLGGRKKWYDEKMPEWLWCSIFFLFILAICWSALNIGRFGQGEALSDEMVQIGETEFKTPLEAEIATTGVASWYDYDLNGIEWSKEHDTCAIKDVKRYSMVRATNLENGKSVDCYVNDYGPQSCEERIKNGFDKPGECIERIIDLSSHAFNKIADKKLGLINVKIEIIK